MNILAIDTATEAASVALSVGTTLFSREKIGARQHAQHLLPMIQSLLEEQHLSWASLHGIALDIGPGSFTGLRIGCSIAKALAYAHNLPLYGISSMHALAFQARAQGPHSEAGILVCGDARMQELYWAYYPPYAPLDSGQIQVSPVRDLEKLPETPLIIAGWGLESYVLPKLCIAQYAMVPKAETLIKIVQNGDCPAQSAAELIPLYVRNQVTHGEARG